MTFKFFTFSTFLIICAFLWKPLIEICKTVQQERNKLTNMIGAQGPNLRTNFAAEILFYGTGKNNLIAMHVAIIQNTEVWHHRKVSWGQILITEWTIHTFGH